MLAKDEGDVAVDVVGVLAAGYGVGGRVLRGRILGVYAERRGFRRKQGIDGVQCSHRHNAHCGHACHLASSQSACGCGAASTADVECGDGCSDDNQCRQDGGERILSPATASSSDAVQNFYSVSLNGKSQLPVFSVYLQPVVPYSGILDQKLVLGFGVHLVFICFGEGLNHYVVKGQTLFCGKKVRARGVPLAP